MRKKSILVLVMVIVLVMTNLVFAEILYNLIPLGDLPGGSSTTPYWISHNGQIVGSGFPATGKYAAIKFDSTGGGNNIRLSINYSCARAVNNRGQIVGYDGSPAKATLFDSTGAGNNITLGTGTDIYGCRAYAINDNSQVVGGSGNGPQCKAWLFDITGNMNNLYIGQGEAVSISDNSFIVGSSHPIVDAGWHATRFDATGGLNNVDLGKLYPTDDRSFATSVNNYGQIVGYSGGPGSYTATLYEPTGNGNNIALGAIGNSYARCINNSGQIVGSENGYATLFDITGSGNNINLNDLIDPSLGWSLSNAIHINDNGQIVGTGNKGAYLLEPIPEPATPPIADADGPYTIYVGDTLTLDANGSVDDDNDITSYMWDLDDNGSFETDACNHAIFDVNYTYLQSLGLLVNNTYNIHLKVTDSQQQSDVNDSTLTIVPKPALVVSVDIKPTSCPNPLNVKSSGVLPVAILGTEDFDVNEIVPTSIQLAGIDAIRNDYEDVAAPLLDVNDCNCTKAGPDGFLDLTLKFKTQRIVEAIGDVNDGDVLTLELTGVLFGERPIEGADCILIRGKHKPFNKADINKDGVVNILDFSVLAENWLQSSIVEN